MNSNLFFSAVFAGFTIILFQTGHPILGTIELFFTLLELTTGIALYKLTNSKK